MPNSLAIPPHTRAFGWLRRNPPSCLSGALVWLAVIFIGLWLLRLIPAMDSSSLGWLQILIGVVLFALGLPLLVRIIRKRMLWSLRNKLIITYLLVGLAPVVLFVTLATIFAYIAAGQFAIHLASNRMQTELDQMSTDNSTLTIRIAHGLNTPAENGPSGQIGPRGPFQGLRTPFTVTERAAAAAISTTSLRPRLEEFINGVPQVMPGPPRPAEPLGLPAWAMNPKDDMFRSVVLDGEKLYLVAIHRERLLDGRRLTMVSHLPVDGALLEIMAKGLGRAQIFAHKAEGDGLASERNTSQYSSVSGGVEPPARNLADIRVRFLSTITITDWETGKPDSVPIEVDSRPGLLYLQLFGESLSGIVTSAIRIGLIGLCILFALIEILALTMAIRLSRTMTASIHDLYEATLSIDRGDLNHRIAVSRTDQLAQLSRSFNRMSVSLQRLLSEQHEKERLQNELTIAQEVQANLFPTAVRDLATLELHGVCRPARSVSGDYYDFLVFYKDDPESLSGRIETGVGIALGDISGKGISAALLMATLHSAVRLIYSASLDAGMIVSHEGVSQYMGRLFESPGRVMATLNQHLYSNTQPEKYATLFLGHYDAATSWLTYSNAGQLPPLLLGQDGSVRRLDKGGTVVGLMDGVRYEEGRFQMRSGDILVAYSDGVTEPENDFGDFGEERLVEVVRRYRDQPLHVISAQVMHALDAWIGAEEQPDDITLVLARKI
ncbi:MAG: SpoIIE family protein phosphatase [Granulicella sp.]